MNSSAAIRLPVTVAEYLERELRSEDRHEYAHGRVYKMEGESKRNNMIVGDVYSLLREHLRGSKHQICFAAVKVQIADASGEIYYYPDIFVTSELLADDARISRGPKLIVEIVSEATSRTDHCEKLINYQSISSVEEMVLIEQDWPEILVYRRADRWKRHLHTQFETMVGFESIGFAAPLSAFYESAPFPADAPRPWYHTNRIED